MCEAILPFNTHLMPTLIETLTREEAESAADNYLADRSSGGC